LPDARARRRADDAGPARGLSVDARDLPHGVGVRGGARARARRGRGNLPDEGRGPRADRRGDPRARERGATVKLTSENTAIVLDSTADFPEAVGRFPNFRIVPLYVNFGAESYRDYVDLGPDELYRRLVSESPTTSQPTPGDFLAAYQ